MESKRRREGLWGAESEARSGPKPRDDAKAGAARVSSALQKAHPGAVGEWGVLGVRFPQGPFQLH